MGNVRQNVSMDNVSRVEFVKNQILDWIHQQGLRPGDRLLSESRLAEQLGVGPVTAHKAFRALADAGVVVRYPNRKGTFIKGAAVRTIGILGWRDERKFFADPYYGRVMAGVDDVLHERDVPFMFKAVDENTKLERLFADVPVSGILAIGSNMCRYCSPGLQEMARRHPLLIIGAQSKNSRLNIVSSDYLNDSRDGVARLIRAGHKRIAALAGPAIPERLAGFKAAMKMAGIAPDKRLIFSDTQKDKLEAVVGVMRCLRPTAIFDARGFIAPLILPDLLSADLQPEILAYDDFHDELSRFPVPATVIRQPMEQLGRTAARQLLGLIDGNVKPPVRVTLRAEMIPVGTVKVRAS